MPVLPSYRNQSIDLLCKSIDWFLYDGNTGFEWVKRKSGYRRTDVRTSVNSNDFPCHGVQKQGPDLLVWLLKYVLFFKQHIFSTQYHCCLII